jgi:hypothetical protein
VPEPSPPKVDIAVAHWKRYKSPGTDRISAEVIQTGGGILPSKMH